MSNVAECWDDVCGTAVSVIDLMTLKDLLVITWNRPLKLLLDFLVHLIKMLSKLYIIHQFIIASYNYSYYLTATS